MKKWIQATSTQCAAGGTVVCGIFRGGGNTGLQAGVNGRPWSAGINLSGLWLALHSSGRSPFHHHFLASIACVFRNPDLNIRS